jgi:hypothetical protein
LLSLFSGTIFSSNNDEEHHKYLLSPVRVMVFNAIFNNISVISWRSVLLKEENIENNRPEHSMFSPGYCRKIAHLAININHSLKEILLNVSFAKLMKGVVVIVL